MEQLDKTFLEEKQKEISVAFEVIQADIKKIEEEEMKLQQMKGQKNVELFRLQGEHRLIKKLLESPETSV